MSKQTQEERDQLRAEFARLQALDAARANEVDAVNARLIQTRKERDDYRERLVAACKEVFDLEAKVKLLTKERDKERANFELLRKNSNKWHMEDRDDYWEEVFRMRSQIDGWRTRCEIAEQSCKPFSQVRPEPSRLEIAAMLFAGGAVHIDEVFRDVDALIAAAKEKPVA